MPRLLIPAAIVLVGLTLYALFEAVLTPAHRVRALPKWVWIAVVVLVPLVGPLLWLFAGRARTVRGVAARPAPRPSSPDDDEEFLRTLRTQRRQAEREKDLDRRAAELRAREEELRRRRAAGQDPEEGPASSDRLDDPTAGPTDGTPDDPTRGPAS